MNIYILPKAKKNVVLFYGHLKLMSTKSMPFTSIIIREQQAYYCCENCIEYLLFQKTRSVQIVLLDNYLTKTMNSGKF